MLTTFGEKLNDDEIIMFFKMGDPDGTGRIMIDYISELLLK